MTSAGSPIRVGLLGYGIAGRVFHAPLIASTPGMRLDAIVTADADRRREARKDHPGARLLDSGARRWAAADDLDLVVIAAPNRLHVPLALAAVEAGIPVVVDKPLAPTAAEGRAVVAAAERAGVALTVFQNRRWDGDFLTVRRLIDDGSLGRVLRFESRFERWNPDVGSGFRESGDPEDAGGQLFDLGAHLVDQALQLFGPVTTVYAELDRRRAGTAVDDDAFVALAHASGTRSHLWMSVVAAQAGPRMRVLGDRAAYVKSGMDVQEAALRSGARPGQDGWGEETPDRWGLVGADRALRAVRTERGRYEDFYAAVAAAVRDGSPMPVDPADSIQVLELIEAARLSAASGETVRVD